MVEKEYENKDLGDGLSGVEFTGSELVDDGSLMDVDLGDSVEEDVYVGESDSDSDLIDVESEEFIDGDVDGIDIFDGVEDIEDLEEFEDEEIIDFGLDEIDVEGDEFVDEYAVLGDFEFDIEDINEEEVVPLDVVYDSKGNPVHVIKDGEMKIGIISIDDIDIPPRARQFNDTFGLEESLRQWGLLEPIHVIPYKERYILVHGYRRLLAYRNMGNEVIAAVVDTTRPKETVRYLEVLANRTVEYNFIEMMAVGAFIEERQKSFSHDTIENLLGMPSGAYLKAKYIDAAKTQFEDVYMKVVRGKMTIDMAFKKIEKELNKEEEELTPLEHLNKHGLPGDEYGQVDEGPDYVQTKGERHPLDPTLRKFVEGRDQHSCQSCGMGLGVPDFATLFHVHHMIPVKHGGPDKKGNLILLCQNCHAMVHGYDEGRFKPNADLTDEFDVVHNAVLLGNIVKKGLPVDYVGEAYEFYMDRARQFWLDADAFDEYVGEYDEVYEEEVSDHVGEYSEHDLYAGDEEVK